MFLKKLLYKFKVKLYDDRQYFKYTFELFISNNEDPIIYQYPYYTCLSAEEVARIIFIEGLSVDNWFINSNQISSLKLINVTEQKVYLRNDMYLKYENLTGEEIHEFNNKYSIVYKKSLT